MRSTIKNKLILLERKTGCDIFKRPKRKLLILCSMTWSLIVLNVTPLMFNYRDPRYTCTVWGAKFGI